MISMVWPLAAGNAIRVFLNPPATAVSWRVLRNATGIFVDENDANSIVVYEGDDPGAALDALNVLNGVPYWYAPFYFDGTDWTSDTPVTATAAASYADFSVDAQSILRDRLDYGFQTEVLRGTLTSSTGAIPVLLAPPEFDQSSWPIVTVHVQNVSPSLRSLGDEFGVDEQDIDGTWTESDGMQMGWMLNVSAWTKNADERVLLRQILNRLFLTNLGIFAGLGLSQVEYSFQDVDLIQGEFPAPVYSVSASFSCQAPAVVRDSVPELVDVTVTGTAAPPNLITETAQ